MNPFGLIRSTLQFNLNPVVGRSEVCGFWGAGARRDNTEMVIPFQNADAAMCIKVCDSFRSGLAQKVRVKQYEILLLIMMLIVL